MPSSRSRDLVTRIGSAGCSPSLQAITSMGLAQAVAAATGVLRIPLAITSLGPQGFGYLAILMSLFVWLSVPPAAYRNTIRLLQAESTTSAHLRIIELRGMKQLQLVTAGSFGIATLLLLIVAQAGSTDSLDFVLALVVSILMFSTSLSGSARLGALESSGRIALVNLLSVAGSLLSLCGSVWLHWVDGSLYLWAITFALPMVFPSWTAFIVTRNASFDLRRRTSLLFTNLRISAVQQMQNGLDPLIIGSMIGAIAVGQYMLVNRAAMVLLLITVGLQPVLVRRFGTLRSAGATPEAIRRSQIITSVGLFAFACAIAIPFALSNEQITGILGGDVISVPATMYWVVAAQAAVFAWQTPLFAALGGPSGISLLSRTFAVIVPFNLLLSLALVDFGLWGPTLASVIISAATSIYLAMRVKRKPVLLIGVHQ